MDIDTQPETAVAQTVDQLIAAQFDSVCEALATLKTQLVPLQAQLRSLEKTVQKELKQRPNNADKKKERAAARKSAGLSKPGRVTAALSEFLKIASDGLVSRAEVSRIVIEYVASHNLQHPENRKLILPDAKLKALFKVADTEQLTFFNLDRYISQQFVA